MSNTVLNRLIEDWWTKSTERVFQQPFAAYLGDIGYRVVHVTRHCGMELGKDVIAIGVDGSVNCFQLKTCRGPRFTLKQWQDEVSPQLADLFENAVYHPSIGTALQHQPWLVVNGSIDEEAQAAIEKRNDSYRKIFGRELKVMVLGDLVAGTIRNNDSLWPSSPERFRLLLEFATADGKSNLDKAHLASLLEIGVEGQKLSKNEAIRQITFLPILTTLAIRSFTATENWVAQTDAWMMCWAYVRSVQLRENIEDVDVQNTYGLINAFIDNSLAGLFEECKTNRDLFQEGFEYAYGWARIRSTWVLGLLSVLAIRKRETGIIDDELEDLIVEITDSDHTTPFVWGEAAIPQVLAIAWLRMLRDVRLSSEFLLLDVLCGILDRNKHVVEGSLPSPYVGPDEYLRLLREPIPSNDQFGSCGYSWYLPILVDQLVDLNWRQELGHRWYEISGMRCESFRCDLNWESFIWRASQGITSTGMYGAPQSWRRLRTDWQELSTTSVCTHFKNSPSLGLLYLIVFPHRVSRELAKAIWQSFWELRNHATN